MENAETYPLVTVVIPTFNRAALVCAAIRSVLEQSWTNLEIVVADDGSTDNTREAIASIRDERLRHIECVHSGHPGRVRNAGARQARGQWIAFLDSDDLWQKEKLSLQMKAVASSGAKWCYGNYAHIDENGEQLEAVQKRFLRLDGMITAEILRNEVAVYIGTVLVHRDTFNRLNGFSEDPRIRFREDLHFVLRLSLEERAVVIQDIVTYVRLHGERSTNRMDQAFRATSTVYELFREENISYKLSRISLVRQAYLLSEAAASKNYGLRFGDRMRLLKKSFTWDKMWHWLHCLFRSLIVKSS